MDHKNVKYVVGGGNYNSQVVELVDAIQGKQFNTRYDLIKSLIITKWKSEGQ